MTRLYLKLSVYIFVCLLPFLSEGQSAIVSPYSRYGIGMLQNENGVQSFSMGQTGNAMRNDSTTPYFVNLKNPASYTYNRITTFEAGVLNDNVTLTSQGVSHTTHNTYFGYFASAFPIPRCKWANACFGITPMSSEGYSISATSPLDSIAPNGQSYAVDNVTTQYTGSGGINNAFLGLSVGIGKERRLSLGANACYLFGNLTNVQLLNYPSNYNNFSVERAQNTNIKSFYFNYGLMYTIGKDSGWHVTAGITFAPASNLNASYNLLAVNYYTGLIYDTIQDSNINGHVRFPMSIGYGISIKKGDQWTFNFDYNTQNWKQYSYFGQPENLNNSTQMGFGVQYVPNKNDAKPHTYFYRIHYRAGFSYNQTYLDINNTALNDYNVSLGFGLPIGKNHPYANISILNIGLQAGQLGTTSNNLIQQRYFKVLFSFTFDDLRFLKREFQ